jgi:hypothetical protein
VTNSAGVIFAEECRIADEPIYMTDPPNWLTSAFPREAIDAVVGSNPRLSDIVWGISWTTDGFTNSYDGYTVEVARTDIRIDLISPVEILRETVDLRARQRWNRKRRR